MINDQFNDTLRAWARRREVSDQRLQALADDIINALPRRQYSMLPAHDFSRPCLDVLSRLAYAAAGAAAVLLVMLCLNPTHPLPTRPTSLPLGLPENYALAKARVVREMNRLFSGQIRWVTEDNDAVKIGIEANMPTDVDRLPSAWVQTVVVTRRAGEATWRPVWSTTILVHHEEQIEVAPSAEINDQLAIWAFAVDKDKWVIDSACSLTTPVRLSSKSSAFIEPGKYREIAALKTEDWEYRVYQTVLNVQPEGNS